MKNQSLVSVIILSYNKAQYLKEAIGSVLFQGFHDFEIIVINDASEDNTENIVKDLMEKDSRIRYFKNETNLGIVKSRNLALSFCEGEYVAVLDSDDIWIDKDKLKKQVEFMENNPDYVLSGGMAKVIDENGKETGKIIYQKEDKEIRKKILLSNQFVHSAVIYRKSIAEMVGGYGEYGVGEDYDLFLKMGLKGKFANLPEVLVSYRRYPSGVTWKNRVFSAKEHLKIIKKYKGKYPNFYLAMIKAYLRIFLAFLKTSFKV